ncbi:MAG: hypothetical protein JOZ38_06995, partial [Candidatus Eremiobacteraeota bacterium]|nr:hypothetical protein [Candidatus Eremiobacteraeota bacterium]
VTCSDLDRATPLDRAAVVMFFWGYEAAKNGATTFRTGMLERATEKLTATCRANPARTLVDAVHDLGVKPF